MAGRVLFPRTRFTTDDLASAYEQLAPVLLPHLARRPLTLKRFPDDIHGEVFWEKDAPSFTPTFVQRLPVPRKGEAGVINYMNLADAKSLRWAASVGCIEIHAFLHRYPFISSPTLIAFDLDPGEGVALTDCCAVALEIHEWFERRELQSFAKVSGSKGLQVYVPLNTASSYALTQALSRRVAEELERQHPSAVISRMARAERTGKVFIDWSQNAEHKTTVSVYSIRAKNEEPLVSIPVTWTEVEQAVSKPRAENLLFTLGEAIARVKEVGDLFAPVLALKQSVPESLVSELGLPRISDPVAVKVPKITAAPYRLPRSAGRAVASSSSYITEDQSLSSALKSTVSFACSNSRRCRSAKRLTHPEGKSGIAGSSI
jgi:bifunctional non-homologous end joining protein LigD